MTAGYAFIWGVFVGCLLCLVVVWLGVRNAVKAAEAAAKERNQ